MKKEIKNGIVIAICVILIIIITYITTSVFMTGEIGTKKDKENKNDVEKTSENTTLQSTYDNMIIAGRVFNQSEDTYMVILFKEDSASDDLKAAIKSYNNENEKLYKVNLDEAINKYVVKESDNNNATNSKELQVKDIALLTISSGSIRSYITDEEQIINALK